MAFTPASLASYARTQGINKAKAVTQQAQAISAPVNSGGTPAVSTPPMDPTVGNINAFYGNLSKQQDSDWGQQQGMLQNQMNSLGRQADVASARMGQRGYTGQIAGMAGAATAQGMDKYNQAVLNYNQLRQATSRDQFSAVQTANQRQQDYNERQQTRTQDHQDHMLDLQLQYGHDLPPDQYEAIFGKPPPGAANSGKGATGQTQGNSYVVKDANGHFSTWDAKTVQDSIDQAYIGQGYQQGSSPEMEKEMKTYIDSSIASGKGMPQDLLSWMYNYITQHPGQVKTNVYAQYEKGLGIPSYQGS